MPTKSELKKQADDLGISYADDVTKADLEAMLAFADEQEPVKQEVEGQCFNCDKTAVYESDGVAASTVRLCADHAPR